MAKARKKKSNVVGTHKAIAEHYGVGTRTVREWTKRVDPMPGKPGAYDIEEIDKWRSDTFLKGKNQRAIGGDGQGDEHQSLNRQLLETKVRKETSLARQNEIKAKKMDDEFVQVSVVEEWVSEFLRLQRDLLTSMPIEMFASAPDEVRKAYQPDLNARIEIHLNQMADWIERAEDLRGV